MLRESKGKQLPLFEVGQISCKGKGGCEMAIKAWILAGRDGKSIPAKTEGRKYKGVRYDCCVISPHGRGGRRGKRLENLCERLCGQSPTGSEEAGMRGLHVAFRCPRRLPVGPGEMAKRTHTHEMGRRLPRTWVQPVSVRGERGTRETCRGDRGGKWKPYTLF